MSDKNKKIEVIVKSELGESSMCFTVELLGDLLRIQDFDMRQEIGEVVVHEYFKLIEAKKVAK